MMKRATKIRKARGQVLTRDAILRTLREFKAELRKDSDRDRIGRRGWIENRLEEFASDVHNQIELSVRAAMKRFEYQCTTADREVAEVVKGVLAGIAGLNAQRKK